MVNRMSNDSVEHHSMQQSTLAFAFEVSQYVVDFVVDIIE